MTTPAIPAADPPEVVEYRAQIQAEWGQYVATENILIDGVLAFLEGQAVPAGHVKRKLVSTSQVEKVANASDAKAAAKEGNG